MRIFRHPIGCVRVFDAYAITRVLVTPKEEEDEFELSQLN